MMSLFLIIPPPSTATGTIKESVRRGYVLVEREVSFPCTLTRSSSSAALVQKRPHFDVVDVR